MVFAILFLAAWLWLLSQKQHLGSRHWYGTYVFFTPMMSGCCAIISLYVRGNVKNFDAVGALARCAIICGYGAVFLWNVFIDGTPLLIRILSGFGAFAALFVAFVYLYMAYSFKGDGD